MEYPAFVKQYKPSGTIVKKQGKTFYVYEATSVRVPGKKYPKQSIKGKVGTVDQNGFHKIKKITINIDDINVFEFGFSDYIYSYLESYKSKNMAIPRKEISKIFKSYIIYLSPNSYFSLEEFYTMQELSERFKLSTSQQLESIREILEIENYKEIEFLKSLIMIKSDKKTIIPKLTTAQVKRLEEIGLYERDYSFRLKSLREQY